MYVSEEEMGLCSCVPMDNVHDVALCCNTIRNVALGLWLVATPAIARQTHKPISKPPMSNPQSQAMIRPSQGFCAAQFMFTL